MLLGIHINLLKPLLDLFIDILLLFDFFFEVKVILAIFMLHANLNHLTFNQSFI